MNESENLLRFIRLMREKKASPIIEVGTHRSVKTRATHKMPYFDYIKREDYVMSDIFSGEDVDVVANIHNLPKEWSGRFRGFIATAVFEHLERPWIAAKEIARVLQPGGLCYVFTHQTFPLHGFPHDFFRFSKEALALIFEDAGMQIISCGYLGRAKITPPPEILAPGIVDAWNAGQPSWIGVDLVAMKPEVTKPRALEGTKSRAPE